MISRATSLSEHIVRFCRFLRLKGFAAGTDDEALSLQALQFINCETVSTFRLCLKSTVCRSKTQIEQFDFLFNDYWRQAAIAADSKIKKGSLLGQPATPQPLQFNSLKAWLHGNRNEETLETAAYSRGESLSKKDFSIISGKEVEELAQIIKAIANRLALRMSRRHKFSHQANMPDLRLTLRKNLRRGGELLELAYRKKKQNRTKLVLLCDVSKSMELYTVFLIQFMYAFQQLYGRIETFSFSTSLRRITNLLKGKDFKDTLKLLGDENDDWAGGTRIGESLERFLIDYSKQMIDSKTIVIILSDGWDKGDMKTLERSMRMIKARSKKIIWLNPLAGFDSYRPEAGGMQTAMPFIDVFAPAHNAESLRQLEKWLR